MGVHFRWGSISDQGGLDGDAFLTRGGFWMGIRILSTSKCSWMYGPHTEMGIVSCASACSWLGLDLVEISGCHAPSPLSYTKGCLAFFSPILSHALKILSMSQCSWGYRPSIEWNCFSIKYFIPSARRGKDIRLIYISPMSYARRCLVSFLLFSPIHTLYHNS